MHFEDPQEHENLAEATEKARNIACDLELIDRNINPHDLRFTHIVETLRNSGLLESQIDRVKRLFIEELGDFGERLENDVWEMLTVLELFDPETARHCVNTYHIAKHKVEEPLFNGMVLAKSFKEEGVTTGTFYVSCLLHDIGKIEVPHSVVVNRVSDEECASLLIQERDAVLIPALRAYLNNPSYTLPDSIDSTDSLLTYLYESLHIRPKEITPIHILLGDLTSEQRDVIEKQLTHCGNTLNDTLLHIMHTHDRYSREILQQSGRTIEATLAGSHHKNRERTYTITIGTIQVSVDLADIIHLADVEQAMTSMRHYKSEHTPLQALKMLAIHAKQGAVDAYISYLWIADTLQKRGVPSTDDESDRETYDFVAHFLDEMKREHLAYPEWRKNV